MEELKQTTNGLFSIEADLTKYPETILQPAPDMQFTIGDLHANALKFIYFLITIGILKLSADDYQTLAAIYDIFPDLTLYEKYTKLNEREAKLKSLKDRLNRLDELQGLQDEKEFREKLNKSNEILAAFLEPALTQNIKPLYDALIKTQKILLNKFQEILNSATVDNNIGLIRLIGDTLADRGKDDCLMLLIFKKLADSRVPMEILFSNHDDEFTFRYTENKLAEQDVGALDQEGLSFFQKRNLIERVQNLSMYTLSNNLKNGVVELENVEDIVEQIYKKHLKLISCSLEKENDESIKVKIFSHAPICIRTIMYLAVFFAIKFPKNLFSDPLDLLILVEKINKKFNDYVKNGDLGKKHSVPEEENGEISINCPLVRTIWNRVIQETREPEISYNIEFAHGHTPGIREGYTNLDNENTLGKDYSYFPKPDEEAVINAFLRENDPEQLPDSIKKAKSQEQIIKQLKENGFYKEYMERVTSKNNLGKLTILRQLDKTPEIRLDLAEKQILKKYPKWKYIAFGGLVDIPIEPHRYSNNTRTLIPIFPEQ